MVLAPNDLFSWNNKYNKYNIYTFTNTFTCFSWAMHINLLCACWPHETMLGSSSLASCRLITSSLFPCLGLTDAPCSRLGDPAPPSLIWLPHSQGLRTLPYRDPEQLDRIGLRMQISADTEESDEQWWSNSTAPSLSKLLPKHIWWNDNISPQSLNFNLM